MIILKKLSCATRGYVTSLNIISSFIFYSFFIIIYSSYIHSQQLYFSIKNVISTTLFAILSQESHQNLMWKIITSSNLNPLLKFYFYSPILANNNMLLKIYYENIVVAFLNCIFHFFLSIIHTFPFLLLFFFFFSLDFSPPHTYTHYLHPLLFVFSTLHFILEPPSLDRKSVV